MGELVSVIVPVYKVESFLDKCVGSIVGQTYRELEILLIDDQSPDRCPEMCDRWAERDSRIRVIHKQNEGVGRARNAGMESASGNYIMFVDSDDYLQLDAVQVLLERLKADGSDMVIGKNVQVFEDGHTDGGSCDFFRDRLLTQDEFLAAMGEKRHYPVAPWGKLYSRKALDGISFPPLACGEDLWVFPLIIMQCASVSVVDHVVYYYVQRQTSITHIRKKEHYLAEIQARMHMVDVFLLRGEMNFAGKWFAAGIEVVDEMEKKQDGVTVIEESFEQSQIRRVLKSAQLRVRVKWFLLHHLEAYQLIFGIKRRLSALAKR